MPTAKVSLQQHRQPTSPRPNTGRFSSTPRAASPDNSSCTPSNSTSVSDVARFCYPFFAGHLHNPYPTRREKEDIVESANLPHVTLKSVDTWFVNARRRCGWTTICNERYNGDSTAMVDFCTRGLKEINSPHPSSAAEPAEKILAMQRKVRSWHNDQTEPSSWVKALSDVIQRYSEEDKERMEHAYMLLVKGHRTELKGKTKSMSEILGKHLHDSAQIPHSVEDIPDPAPVAGGKRKLEAVDEDAFGRECCVLRNASSTSSLSSNSSDCSLEGMRVPSLTWSDTEDERPCKRARPERSSPRASSVEDFASPSSSYHPSSPKYPASGCDSAFTFSVPWPTSNDPFASLDLEDFDNICHHNTKPHPKRLRTPDDNPEDENESRCEAKRLRTSTSFYSTGGLEDVITCLDGSVTVDPCRGTVQPIERALHFSSSQPQPAQVIPPDAMGSLDVGVFDWASFLDDITDPSDSALMTQRTDQISTASGNLPLVPHFQPEVQLATLNPSCAYPQGPPMSIDLPAWGLNDEFRIDLDELVDSSRGLPPLHEAFDQFDLSDSNSSKFSTSFLCASSHPTSTQNTASGAIAMPLGKQAPHPSCFPTDSISTDFPPVEGEVS